MVNIKENARTLYCSRRSGASLMVSMCVCLALLGLSLSVVYSASVLLRRAERKAAKERCCQLAGSFADLLKQELGEPSFAEGSFSAYVNNCLAGWDGACDFRTSAAGENATLTVTMKPFSAETPSALGGSFYYGESADGVTRAWTENFFVHFRFSVEITAELMDERYSCTDSYCRTDRFAPRFFCGETPVFWNGEAWYLDETFILPFDLPEESAEAAVITYTYDTEEVVEMAFLPAVREGGGLQ